MKLIVVAAVWAVTLWRWPTPGQEPWKRVLWVAFAALAAGLTFSLPEVDQLVFRASGVTALATLLKHLCAVVACTAVLEWVVLLTRPSRRRVRAVRWLAVTAAVAMAGLFLRVDARPGDFADAMAGDRAASVYLLSFETYLALAMATAAAMFLLAASRAPAGSLRWGLWALATGASLGLTYAVTRSLYLIEALPRVDVPGSADGLYRASEAIQLSAISLIAIGSSLPALPAISRTWWAYRNLNALRPLWRELTAAASGTVLGPPPGRAADLLPLADLDFRLLRRTAEIRDARLALRGYIGDADLASIRHRLQCQGLEGSRLEAAVEAAWLHAALAARRSGHAPRPASGPPAYGGDDLRSEVSWLRTIAAAGRDPAITACTQQARTDPEARHR